MELLPDAETFCDTSCYRSLLTTYCRACVMASLPDGMCTSTYVSRIPHRLQHASTVSPQSLDLLINIPGRLVSSCAFEATRPAASRAEHAREPCDSTSAMHSSFPHISKVFNLDSYPRSQFGARLTLSMTCFQNASGKRRNCILTADESRIQLSFSTSTRTRRAHLAPKLP